MEVTTDAKMYNIQQNGRINKCGNIEKSDLGITHHWQVSHLTSDFLNQHYDGY